MLELLFVIGFFVMLMVTGVSLLGIIAALVVATAIMFLGSMLSSLFGLGNFGWAADFLGLLFNVVLIYVLFKAVSAVWRAIRDRRHRS